MRVFLTILFSLIVPIPAFAAVAFDTSTFGLNGVATSPAYFTITPTGSDTAVCVGNAGAVSGTDSVTQVDIGTVSGTSTMTKMGGIQKPSDRYTDLWCLVGTYSTTQTIKVTFTGTYESALAALYSGVGTIDAAHTLSGSSATTFSDTTTPLQNNAWVAGVSGNSNRDPTAGAGTVIRVNCSGCGMSMSDSNSAISPAAPYTLNWASAVAGTWADVIVALEPTAAATVVKVPNIIFYGAWDMGW